MIKKTKKNVGMITYPKIFVSFFKRPLINPAENCFVRGILVGRIDKAIVKDIFSTKMS